MLHSHTNWNTTTTQGRPPSFLPRIIAVVSSQGFLISPSPRISISWFLHSVSFDPAVRKVLQCTDQTMSFFWTKSSLGSQFTLSKSQILMMTHIGPALPATPSPLCPLSRPLLLLTPLQPHWSPCYSSYTRHSASGPLHLLWMEHSSSWYCLVHCLILFQFLLGYHLLSALFNRMSPPPHSQTSCLALFFILP